MNIPIHPCSPRRNRWSWWMNVVCGRPLTWHSGGCSCKSNKHENKSIPSPTHQSFFPNLPRSRNKLQVNITLNNTLTNLGSHFMLTFSQELQLPSRDLCTGRRLLVCFSSTILILEVRFFFIVTKLCMVAKFAICEEYGHLISEPSMSWTWYQSCKFGTFKFSPATHNWKFGVKVMRLRWVVPGEWV